MAKVFGRFDERAVSQQFEQAGVLRALQQRGFHDFDVRIDDQRAGLERVQVYAHKGNERHLLVDGCLTESIARPEYFRTRGYAMDAPIRLASVYWLREEDPTANFASDRPPLPLQRHPGLGVLRATFHVIVEIARDCGFDGVACVPKFFHDAAIFYRSRLFLFLDGAEQGRFEALLAAAGGMSLNVASSRLWTGAMCDAAGTPVVWSPGPQVCPLSPRLVNYFHSSQYAEQVRAGSGTHQFTCGEPVTPVPAATAP